MFFFFQVIYSVENLSGSNNENTEEWGPPVVDIWLGMVLTASIDVVLNLKVSDFMEEKK